MDLLLIVVIAAAVVFSSLYSRGLERLLDRRSGRSS
jgi:hypothetical protein